MTQEDLETWHRTEVTTLKFQFTDLCNSVTMDLILAVPKQSIKGKIRMMPGFSHILHGALNTIYCDIVQTGANRKKDLEAITAYLL